MMKRLSAAFEQVLRWLKAIGHPAVFFSVVAGTIWVVLAGQWPPVPAILLSAVAGLIAGFRMALTVFSHILTKNPEVILQTVQDWKRDGRWDQLVAHIARERHGR